MSCILRSVEYMSSDNLKPATTYPAIVGRILVNLRKAAGIGQDELAESVGITQSTLSRVERGESALTVDQLARAAKRLGGKASNILEMADNAVEELNDQGINVQYERVHNGIDTGLVLIGAAALGALIAAIICKK